MAEVTEHEAADAEEVEEAFQLGGPEELQMEVSNEFIELFREFDNDIDGLLLEKAWKQYDQIRQQVLLEGNEKAWMACAFYTNSFQATPYGQDPVYTYSLLKLLRACNVSVLEFFNKLNRWLDMISASRRLLEHASKVEGSLSVSTVIYKKYLRIFRAVFRIHPVSANSNPIANVTTAELFEFIWIALVALKKCLPAGMEDLLSSYHLLISLVEICFSELKQVDSPILNPDFVKLMSPDDSPLDFMCRQFDGVELDAKHMRIYWILPAIRELEANGTLSLPTIDPKFPIQLLGSMDENKQNLNQLYETQMLKKMEVDERVFISHVIDNVDMVFNESLDNSAITILRRSNLNSQWAVDADLLLRMSTQSCLQKVQIQAKPLNTPLSARSYIISSEQFIPVTPVSAASYKAQKVAELITQDYKNSDGEFYRLLSHCQGNVKAFVSNTVEALEQLIARRCEEEASAFGPQFDSSFAVGLPQRLAQVEQLFYRLLQVTILYDRARNPRADASDLTAIIHKQDFIQGLYVAAFELVAMAYDSQREFPWSVNTIKMAPINFYKIIEVIIRADPELSRDMVKHLNRCEEKVLDELAWQLDSPLWQALQKRPEIPSCETVLQDGHGSLPMQSRYMPSPMKPLDRLSAKRKIEYGDDDMVPQKRRQDEYGMPSGTSLFFRKFYYLAAIRLTDLADRIRMEEGSRNRVWTLFEHVIRNETNLMAGRHLDQNLMCCLYIVSKLTKADTSFHSIIHQYRNQPQSNSRIYRKVRVEAQPGQISDDGASRDSLSSFSGLTNQRIFRSGSACPTNGASSNSHTPEPPEQTYVDLIKYYNTVFIPRAEDFVKKMHPANPEAKENIVTILSIPRVTCTTLSPRRMVGEQLAVIPMSAFTQNPRRQFAAQAVPQTIKTTMVPQTVRQYN